METDRGSSESREDTPDSDSGYNAGVVATASSSSDPSPPSAAAPSNIVAAAAQKPKRPSQIAHNAPTSPQQQQLSPNSMLNELRLRQQRQQQVPELEAHYANLVTPPPPPRDQKPMMVAPPQNQMSPTSRNGFPGGSPGGPSLADQLKSRLEERRRSKEDDSSVMAAAAAAAAANNPAFLPDAVAADMKQAVMVANETGKWCAVETSSACKKANRLL
jgi:hypothetical protein